MPLFTPAEEADWAARRRGVEDQYRDPETGRTRMNDWNAYWAAREAVQHAYQIVRARRIQANPQPLLAGLLAGGAGRGAFGLNLLACYDDPTQIPTTGVTDATRRELHTMLLMLRDCPKTWARSAFCRALRGTGAQKDYSHEATGMFGTGSGWKTRDLDIAVRPLWEGVSSEALVWYDPRINAYPDEEMWEAAFAEDGNGNPFAFTLVEKDKDFIDKLLALLDADGMAPAMTRPKKAAKRKGKQWKVGDRVAGGNIRLLPVGTKVQIHLFQRAYGNASKANPHSAPSPDYYIFTGKGRRKATYCRDLYKGGRLVERDQVCSAWAMEGTVLTLPGSDPTPNP